MSPLRVLDLFSGIGGFSLGLERTGGFKTVAFCEIEPFPRRVLAKHWPEVPCYDDVRTLTAERLRADGIAVDVICGGFPCQDISVAGRQAGLDGERSGLWSEIARLAGELRPSFVIVENVAALLSNGLDRVLGDLAALGFDAEWHCIPAAALGAPHRRDRFWLVAHPHEYGRHDEREGAEGDQGHASNRFSALRQQGLRSVRATDVAHADERPRRGGVRVAGQRREVSAEGQFGIICGRGERNHVADANDAGRHEQWRPLANVAEQLAAQRGCGWPAEPDVGRVANGVPSRVDRLRALGNAVVPQIPELIGNAILASMEAAPC